MTQTQITFDSPEAIFGEPIYSYSRSQAIEDGILVDLSANFPELIRNAGLRFPVACTRAVFDQFIDLTPAAKRACNDVTGRAWDVLWMLRAAIARNRETDTMLFRLAVVTNRVRPSTVTLKAVCGPGDNMEPVITIMLPEED